MTNSPKYNDNQKKDIRDYNQPIDNYGHYLKEKSLTPKAQNQNQYLTKGREEQLLQFYQSPIDKVTENSYNLKRNASSGKKPDSYFYSPTSEHVFSKSSNHAYNTYSTSFLNSTEKKQLNDRSNNFLSTSKTSFKDTNSQYQAKAQDEEGVVDIGRMGVNELIELKKIIDERIEIQELKTKKTRYRSPSQKIIQRADEIINSPDNQKYSLNKSPLRESGFQSKTQYNNPHYGNFRKTDGFVQRDYSEDQANFYSSTPKANNFKDQAYRSVGNQSKAAFDEYHDPDFERSLRNTRKTPKEVEKLYEMKLQELYQVRDLMMKLEEVSSAEIEDAGFTKREPEKSSRFNDQNLLLTSKGLFQFNSPQPNKTPIKDLPRLSPRDLLATPETQSFPSTQKNKNKNTKINQWIEKGFETSSPQVKNRHNTENFSFAENYKLKKSPQKETHANKYNEQTSLKMMEKEKRKTQIEKASKQMLKEVK